MGKWEENKVVRLEKMLLSLSRGKKVEVSNCSKKGQISAAGPATRSRAIFPDMEAARGPTRVQVRKERGRYGDSEGT